jgi:hypothetical protein
VFKDLYHYNVFYTLRDYTGDIIVGPYVPVQGQGKPIKIDKSPDRFNQNLVGYNKPIKLGLVSL